MTKEELLEQIRQYVRDTREELKKISSPELRKWVMDELKRP